MILLLSIITEYERIRLSELIVRIAGGDENALAEIYDKAGGRLLSVAMGLVRI